VRCDDEFEFPTSMRSTLLAFVIPLTTEYLDCLQGMEWADEGNPNILGSRMQQKLSQDHLEDRVGESTGAIRMRQRLGGLLKSCHHADCMNFLTIREHSTFDRLLSRDVNCCALLNTFQKLFLPKKTGASCLGS
jgi:hypothetical protein